MIGFKTSGVSWGEESNVSKDAIKFDVNQSELKIIETP